MNELVSVIVPVYNVEKYIKKCLNSIINQTYKNLEIILVDDGSPDNCPQICDEYAKKDSRIKVIHKANGGLSDARNAGVAASTGEYIGFVDSDDYIEPNMYERLYELINENNADISLCAVQKEDERGNSISQFTTDIVGMFEDEEIFDKINLNNPYFIIACNRLYKKHIVQNTPFPVGFIHEDEFTTHRFFGLSKKVVCSNDRLYHYLERQGSIMGSGFSIKKMDAVYAFLDRYTYFKEQDNKKMMKNSAVLIYSKAVHIISNLDVSKNSYEVKKCVKSVLPVIIRYNPLKALKLQLIYMYRRGKTFE